MPQPMSEGPTETVSASVPSELVERVRASIGPREFSSFVSYAMERELVRLNRARFLALMEGEAGPPDPKDVEYFERALRE